jgi:hypothetical protein
MAVIEGLFLKFLDDSLGNDRPDALDDTRANIFLNAGQKPVTEAGTNVPFRVGAEAQGSYPFLMNLLYSQTFTI